MLRHLSEANATDAETSAAVNASSNALDEAFTKKDVATIKALMTEDHLTVTPYYLGPQTVDDQLASLGEYDWSQTIVGEPEVTLLTPPRTSKAPSRASPCRRACSRPSFWSSVTANGSSGSTRSRP